MWCVGRLKVHGICNRRLVYREIVKTRSDYKKSYLWWFRNIACGDSTGLKKAGFVYLLKLFRGTGRWGGLI